MHKPNRILKTPESNTYEMQWIRAVRNILGNYKVRFGSGRLQVNIETATSTLIQKMSFRFSINTLKNVQFLHIITIKLAI